MIESTPKFLQSVSPFSGAGYDKPVPIEGVTYNVSSDKRAQLLYFRAGNSSAELIYLALMRDGKLMRYFPIGAKACDHVSLAVVEDLSPETRLEVMVGAPAGASGTLVLDIGLVEI